MRVSEQQRADILRYHFVEQWRVGTIATQLGIHHSSVDQPGRYAQGRTRQRGVDH